VIKKKGGRVDTGLSSFPGEPGSGWRMGSKNEKEGEGRKSINRSKKGRR